MALPTALSLTLIATGTPCSRPFLSSGGNVYVVGRSGTSTLGAKKATDPTSSFSTAGTDVTLANTLQGVSAVQLGDNIHVVTLDGSSVTSVNYRYHVFSMNSDSWTTSNENIATAIDPAVNNVYEALFQVGIRSDGDVILIYNGQKAASMGSDYRRVKYARREGGTWTTNIALDNAGATHWEPYGLIIGASDRMHFLFADQSAGSAYQRSLTSANSLQTFPSAFATSLTAAQGSLIKQGASYVSSSVTKVRMPLIGSATTTANSYKFDSADTPTITSDSDITGSTNTTSENYSLAFAADGTTLWHLFNDSSSFDLYTQSNANDGGWSTPSSFATHADSQYRMQTNVYTRGGNVVLAMTYARGSDVYYNESVLSVGGVTGTSSVTLGAATNSGDGDVFIAGTSSPTLATVQTTTDGDIAVQGTSSTTLSAATNTTDGDVLVQGTSSTTLDSVTPSADGSVFWNGSSDVTLATVATTADGSISIQGTSSVTLATVQTTTDADALVQGTSTTSLAAATNSGDGDVFVQADSSTTLATVTQDASGTVGSAPAIGDSSVTLDGIQATQSGSVSIAGTQTASLDAAANSATTSVFILGDSSSLLAAIANTGEGAVLILASSSVQLDSIQQSADGAIGDFISGESSVLLATIEVTASGQVFGVPDSVLQARGGGVSEQQRRKKRKQQPKQPFTIQVKQKEAPLPSREAIDRLANSLYKARTFQYISEPAKAPLIRKLPVQKQNEPDYDELIALLLLSM